MKIAFFTEMSFEGKIPRNHSNMRTEFAWMCALEADHYNTEASIHICNDLNGTPSYDLGIVILPKKKPILDITPLYKVCKKLAIMQEGPNWYWQDYTMDQQINYVNALAAADIIYVHNDSDRKYYQGLIDHPDVRVMPSLMIEDTIPKNIEGPRSGVIIGGNMTSWYGGFDSMMIAQVFGESIYAPSMGRKIPMEEQLDIQHLPYMEWSAWIQQLNNFKYGVHLMRTHAAGTFALNCAYLGIPCIGYEGLDTQMICHPDLTVAVGDLTSARELAQKLRNNQDFYLYCSESCKKQYKEHYSEDKFYNSFEEQFKIS
jgi:hypothetical protein